MCSLKPQKQAEAEKRSQGAAAGTDLTGQELEVEELD